jgi:hypothetical protein
LRSTGGGIGSDRTEPLLIRNLLTAVIATTLSVAVAAIGIESWVRLRWDETRGMPGFYVSDPVLGIRLNPNYDGWFAGVPAHINALGFRDNRDYDVVKQPGTFRVLVLGDSVTFGHGTLFETTYPYLLEERLKSWRPSTNWQVWNLGVPGYNTGQELSLLKQVGPRYQPDLVVVGFYPNDLTNNEVIERPSLSRRISSAIQRAMQSRLYSYEFYKRAVLTMRFQLFTSAGDRARLEQLANEDALLAKQDVSSSSQQQLTDVDYFTDEQVSAFVCPGESSQTDPKGANDLRVAIRDSEPEITRWLQAVRALQQLHRDGIYRIVFFLNLSPKVCKGDDRFYDAGSFDEETLLLEILGDGTPAVSSLRRYLHHRPSQMPGAGGHSVGNANRVKADVLFEFLRDRELVR